MIGRLEKKRVKLRVSVNSQTFSYTGKVIELFDNFLTLHDELTDTYFTFNKLNIISIEELKD